MAKLAYMLAFLGWLFLMVAASEWFRLSRRADRSTSRPVEFSDLERPAFVTGLALALLSVPLIMAIMDHMERFSE